MREPSSEGSSEQNPGRSPFAWGTALNRCTESLRGEADCVRAFGLRGDIGAKTAAVGPVCPVGSTVFCVRVAAPMA